MPGEEKRRTETQSRMDVRMSLIEFRRQNGIMSGTRSLKIGKRKDKGKPDASSQPKKELAAEKETEKFQIKPTWGGGPTQLRRNVEGQGKAGRKRGGMPLSSRGGKKKHGQSKTKAWNRCGRVRVGNRSADREGTSWRKIHSEERNPNKTKIESSAYRPMLGTQ